MSAGTPPAARRLFFVTPSDTPPQVARRLFITPSSSCTPSDTAQAMPQVDRRLFVTPPANCYSANCYSPPPEALAWRIIPRRLFHDSLPPPLRQQQTIRLPAPARRLRQRFDTPPPRTYCPEFEPSAVKWNTKAITAHFSNYAPKHFR